MSEVSDTSDTSDTCLTPQTPVESKQLNCAAQTPRRPIDFHA